jgi:hypothetical protein
MDDDDAVRSKVSHPVQITATSYPPTGPFLFALHDDGSVWVGYSLSPERPIAEGWVWQRLPATPTEG